MVQRVFLCSSLQSLFAFLWLLQQYHLLLTIQQIMSGHTCEFFIAPLILMPSSFKPGLVICPTYQFLSVSYFLCLITMFHIILFKIAWHME